MEFHALNRLVTAALVLPDSGRLVVGCASGDLLLFDCVQSTGGQVPAEPVGHQRLADPVTALRRGRTSAFLVLTRGAVLELRDSDLHEVHSTRLDAPPIDAAMSEHTLIIPTRNGVVVCVGGAGSKQSRRQEVDTHFSTITSMVPASPNCFWVLGGAKAAFLRVDPDTGTAVLSPSHLIETDSVNAGNRALRAVSVNVNGISALVVGDPSNNELSLVIADPDHDDFSLRTAVSTACDGPFLDLLTSSTPGVGGYLFSAGGVTEVVVEVAETGGMAIHLGRRFKIDDGNASEAPTKKLQAATVCCGPWTLLQLTAAKGCILTPLSFPGAALPAAELQFGPAAWSSSGYSLRTATHFGDLLLLPSNSATATGDTRPVDLVICGPNRNIRPEEKARPQATSRDASHEQSASALSSIGLDTADLESAATAMDTPTMVRLVGDGKEDTVFVPLPFLASLKVIRQTLEDKFDRRLVISFLMHSSVSGTKLIELRPSTLRMFHALPAHDHVLVCRPLFPQLSKARSQTPASNISRSALKSRDSAELSGTPLRPITPSISRTDETALVKRLYEDSERQRLVRLMQLEDRFFPTEEPLRISRAEEQSLVDRVTVGFQKQKAAAQEKARRKLVQAGHLLPPPPRPPKDDAEADESIARRFYYERLKREQAREEALERKRFKPPEAKKIASEGEWRAWQERRSKHIKQEFRLKDQYY